MHREKRWQEVKEIAQQGSRSIECCYEAAESMLDTSNLEDDYLRDTQEYIDKGVVREESLTQARKEA